MKTNVQGNYGIRWQEFNAKNQLVTKERFFASENARAKFLEKLSYKNNFYGVESTSDKW